MREDVSKASKGAKIRTVTLLLLLLRPLSSVFRRSFRRSKDDDDDVSHSEEGRWRWGRAAGGRVMGPLLMSVVCVRWWSEVWRYGDPHMNFKTKMRRNLKVILLMAIVWAGGLLYLAKNGDKPLKQVSQSFKKWQKKLLFWDLNLCSKIFHTVFRTVFKNQLIQSNILQYCERNELMFIWNFGIFHQFLSH